MWLMKKMQIFTTFIFFSVLTTFGYASISSLSNTQKIKESRVLLDSQLEKLMKEPRKLEKFHYAGSDGEFDVFVGEQWSMHSYPVAAKKTERFYKVKNSKYTPAKKFKVTKNHKRWVLISKAKAPKVKNEDA